MYHLQVHKEREYRDLFRFSEIIQKTCFSEDEKRMRLELGDRNVCQTLIRLGASTTHCEALDVIQKVEEVQGIVDHQTICHPGRDDFGFPTPTSWTVPNFRGLKEKDRALSSPESRTSKRRATQPSSTRKRGK